jgi:hypothetical protein
MEVKEEGEQGWDNCARWNRIWHIVNVQRINILGKKGITIKKILRKTLKKLKCFRILSKRT